MNESTPQPFIIPIFLPHSGCPHQCAFCNQRSITGKKDSLVPPEKIGVLIDEFLKYRKDSRKSVQLAFFGGNFLGLKKSYIQSMLFESSKYVKKKKIDSIRFSTRPDTIDNKRLDLIGDFPVSTIEIGVQSMNDRVLAKARRGHTSKDTEKAFRLLKERNYKTCAQMMVGLPYDDENSAIITSHRIADLLPDYVRIYPTVVLSGSLLAKWYKNGEYIPIPLENCVTLVKKIYLLFSKKKIRVIRMGLQASKDLDDGAKIIAGPYHPAFGHMVLSDIFLDMAAATIESAGDLRENVSIKVHPNSISKMRGLENRNILILKKRYGIKTINIIGDKKIMLSDCSVDFF